MPMSDQNLEETLIKISASLLSVQEQLRTLEDKPALNGAFDEICRQVKELHLVTHRIEDMLISSTTGEGLVMRVKELEGDNDQRKEFMSNTVLPSLEQHREVVFKMKLFDEQIAPAIGDISIVKAEVAKLKYAQAIYSKAVWFLSLTVAGVLVKALMDLIVASP
jgi:hypothetical protein